MTALVGALGGEFTAKPAGGLDGISADIHAMANALPALPDIRGKFGPEEPGPGPRMDYYLFTARLRFPEWSDRTQRTFASAERMAAALKLLTGVDYQQRFVPEATRPNGSFNVSKFRRLVYEAGRAEVRSRGLDATNHQPPTTRRDHV